MVKAEGKGGIRVGEKKWEMTSIASVTDAPRIMYSQNGKSFWSIYLELGHQAESNEWREGMQVPKNEITSSEDDNEAGLNNKPTVEGGDPHCVEMYW